MTAGISALLTLAIVLAAAALGAFIRPRLHERHRSRETIELLNVTVTMLVTFAAIVLGLLITSAKDTFDHADGDLRAYSVGLVSLDQALRGAGAQAERARVELRRYTAAAIASTWSGETAPPGDFYPRNLPTAASDMREENSSLGDLLTVVAQDVEQLPADTTEQRRARQRAEAEVERVIEQRWHLISAVQGSLSMPFFGVLVFWLAVVFLCFGLATPVNRLSVLITGLSAVALSSAVFVVVDLSTLFDTGIFSISSQPLRDALAHMLR